MSCLSWKCSECHHEWQGSCDDNHCDWCHAKGLVLDDHSQEYMTVLERAVRKIIYKIYKGGIKCL